MTTPNAKLRELAEKWNNTKAQEFDECNAAYRCARSDCARELLAILDEARREDLRRQIKEWRNGLIRNRSESYCRGALESIAHLEAELRELEVRK